ncbi:MAG: hypothetical protein VR72_00055 [Clostridiaceae bacterium BRH_c20a]|nr:MAG: hypothetical protein VR72_00055 [Clostridiaceae bacterium BRH_c20a]
MNNKIFYLYPEVEGKQYFVCWGLSKEELNKNAKKEIKDLILVGLKNIKENSNRWIGQRSFSVYLGEDQKFLWVAVPRQISAKAMNMLSANFAVYNPKIVITSMENYFGEKLPFRPVISYDRGFIFDSTAIEEKLSENSEAKIVNI